MAVSARRSSGPVLRSLSPSRRFYSSTSGVSRSRRFYSSTSSMSAFASSSSDQSSPTRVNFSVSSSPSSSVRFSLDRSTSPSRSISVTRRENQSQRKTCMCSPTTHPGSFRCSLHKNVKSSSNSSSSSHTASSYSSNSSRLNMRRSAMTNSLVRIGTVEGDLVKRALAALIRPSSHQQRRRADFQLRPSRLSVMSKADDSYEFVLK